jgi:hypothetical protein
MREELPDGGPERREESELGGRVVEPAAEDV